MYDNMSMVSYLRIRWGGGADGFQKSDSRGDGVDNVQSCSFQKIFYAKFNSCMNNMSHVE